MGICQEGTLKKLFVLISGLPGSEKTTLARRLAPALQLPLIDKDDILERLFESKGTGDAAWRRKSSRESDAILQREATASSGAILVSFWRLHGMPSDSGTPADWVSVLSRRIGNAVVNVHCTCALETAAERFLQRKRHPGHLDGAASYPEFLASLQKLARLGPLDIGHRVLVNALQDPNLEDVVREIQLHHH
jgi:predicted kinase